MRSYILAAALFAAIASTSGLLAQSPSQASETRFPAEALREDLSILHTAINEAHPGATRYLTAAQVEANFEHAREQLDTPMTAIEFYRVVAPLSGSLQDGHTSIRLSQADGDAFRASTPLLPLRLHVTGGRVFILRDLSGTGLAGREIAAINGEPVADILDRLTAIIPGDGASRSGPEFDLSRSFIFNQLLALTSDTTSVYTVTDTDGTTVQLPGGLHADLVTRWREYFPGDHIDHPNAELRFEAGSGIAILTVRAFASHADAAETRTMDAFFADAFAQMRARGSETLILDVRGNGGGRDDFGRLLFSYITREAFEYYAGLYLQSPTFSFAEYADPPIPGVPPSIYARDSEGRMRITENPNYGVHEPVEMHFDGPVYILMDGGSFSTTAEFLSVAHHNHRGVFIGAESGGGYYGNTSGFSLTVTLPNTRLRARIPLQRYELAVEGHSPADRGVPPDYAVSPDITELLSGRDPAMETALRLSQEN